MAEYKNPGLPADEWADIMATVADEEAKAEAAQIAAEEADAAAAAAADDEPAGGTPVASKRTGSGVNPSRDTLIKQEVDDYVAHHEIRLTDLIDSDSDVAAEIRDELVSYINDRIHLENCTRPREEKLASLTSLTGYIVARLLLATGDVKKLKTSQKERKLSDGMPPLLPKRNDRLAV